MTWAGDWLRVLKPGASCFIFAGRRYAHRCISALEDVGFTFKDMIAWEKNKAPHRAQRASAIFERRQDEQNTIKWQGWRVANLRPTFEPILWFQKPYKVGGTLADNMVEYALGAWNEEALKKYSLYENILPSSNIVKVITDSKDIGLHPTQKPLNLMKLLIELVTDENQIILDPFAGSGTTCLASLLLNRQFIGIEADEQYVKIAKERLDLYHSLKYNSSQQISLSL